MKQINFIMVLAAISMFAACQSTTPSKSVEINDEVKELKNFPEAKEEFVRYVVVLPGKGEDEDKYQVEIIPGKNMEVDCNRHILNGKIEEKNLEGFGYTYYEFSSNGQAASTRMACPENSKKMKFVSGETLLVRYNSKLPIVVYVPMGIELKYKIWEASKEVEAKVATIADKEKVKELKNFPNAEKEKVQYVIDVEKKSDETLHKLEIIPGKLMKVDCNRHFLSGELQEKELQGFGYSYYEFNSEGQVGATMMACPENSLTEKFVSSPSKIVRYNSNLPVVIYSSPAYKMKYRVWNAGELKDSKIL